MGLVCCDEANGRIEVELALVSSVGLRVARLLVQQAVVWDTRLQVQQGGI